VFADSVTYTITWTAIVAVLSLPWLRVPRVPWPWVLFLALCVASQLWTIDDAATDASLVLYLKLTALAVLAAASCEAEVVAWGMGLGGVAIVGLSLWAFEHTMWGSSYPVNESGGIKLAFAGVGTNENILAYTLAVSLAAMVALGRPRDGFPLVAWLAVLGVHAYGFYLASSGTGYLATFSILVAAVGVLVWSRLRTVPRRVRHASVAATAALAVAALLVVSVGLDKELVTVSGRAPFWQATIAATLARAPFLGSGWGAVWAHPWAVAPPNAVADDIYARAGYPLPHGHNFFVDVVPEVGILGLLLAVAMVAYAVREVVRNGVAAASTDPVAGRLVLLVLTSLLVSGVSEPMLTAPIGWWSLAMVVALTRQRVPRRHVDLVDG
jgi:O-antigen ligase